MRRARRTRVAVIVASVLLVATAFTLVASVATGSAGAAASALDNFECYSATSVSDREGPGAVLRHAEEGVAPERRSRRAASWRRSGRCRCTAIRRERRSCPPGTR